MEIARPPASRRRFRRSGTRRCPEVVQSSAIRWRSRLAVALVAAAVPFALGAAVAQAAPSAQARLAAVATQGPDAQGHRDRAVQAGLQRDAGRKARRRHHGGKVTSRVPLIHGLAVQLPAKQAKALGRRPQRRRPHAQHARAQHRRSTRASSPPRTRRRSAPTSCGSAASRARGIGVAVIDTGIAGDAADFKDADGSSRVVANVVTSPGATTAGDGFGHGTHVAGIIAGNSFNRAPQRPVLRQVRRHRAGREPDRDQGVRRGRQLDRPGRHQRHRVRRRPQGRVQHPRAQPLAEHRHAAVLQDRPARRRRRVRLAEGHRRRRRRRQPRHRRRRRPVRPGQRSVRDLGRRRRRERQLRQRRARRLVEHRHARRTASPSRTSWPRARTSCPCSRRAARS